MLGTVHSIGFAVLCLLAGLAYAGLLYAKTPAERFPLWLKRTVFVCRTLAVSLIAFLLLRPTVERRIKQTEKPLILVGVDHSESIVMGKDSLYYKGEYLEELQHFAQRLSKDYQVELFSVGDSVRQGMPTDFLAKSTHLSRFFKQMEEQYVHQNVGAMVLLSDGIYTEGTHPLYAANTWKVPVYTVALGDTAHHKDARIAKINYNKTVFKGHLFPLEVLVQAHQLEGKQSRLQVLQSGNLLYEKNITYHAGYSEWIRLHLEAPAAGYLHYTVRIEGVEGEQTLENNVADVVIQVIEESRRIAVVYSAPHPDVAALTESVKGNPQYRVETFPVERFRTGENKYDLYVLHQLPNSRQAIRPLLEEAEKSGASLLYFTGSLSREMRLDHLPGGLQIQSTQNLQNDAYPWLNQDFSDFNLPNGMERMLSHMPPLQVPFGKYRLPSSAKVCIYQKINQVTTNYPLLFLQQEQGGKCAVLMGEGWWRWRMYDYLWNGSHDIFDGFLSQVIQYLLVKENRDFFRVKCQPLFTENERVLFDAELYNKNYELVNQPEVSLILYEAGHPDRKFNYTFSKNLQAYHLDVGRLEAGDYQWQAKVNYGTESYSRSGSFCVQAVQVEALNLTADHQLLRNLADLNGASLFYPGQWDALEKSIREDSRIKAVAHYTKKHHPLMHNWFYFILLILLLGGEWGLRKWSGNY